MLLGLLTQNPPKVSVFFFFSQLTLVAGVEIGCEGNCLAHGSKEKHEGFFLVFVDCIHIPICTPWSFQQLVMLLIALHATLNETITKCPRLSTVNICIPQIA